MVSFPLADDSTIVLLETASEYSALVRADTQQERVNRDSVGRGISNVKRILTETSFHFRKFGNSRSSHQYQIYVTTILLSVISVGREVSRAFRALASKMCRNTNVTR